MARWTSGCGEPKSSGPWTAGSQARKAANPDMCVALESMLAHMFSTSLMSSTSSTCSTCPDVRPPVAVQATVSGAN